MRVIHLRTTATMLGLFCAVVAYAQQPQPTATVPKLVRFSGSFRPATGQPSQSPAPSTESVTLSVYRDQTGGTALWQEVQNVAVDTDGNYSLLMGATQNEGMPLDLFSSGEPRWLGTRFNRPGEVEQPRVLLVSVPYALKASDAETLGGRPASAYLLARAPEESSAAGIAGVTGVTGITATAPSTNKAVKPKSTPANSGQPNYIGKFTNTTDLIDSSMYEVGGNVGISTAAPLISLDVRTGSLPQMGIAGTTDYLTFFASDVFGPAIYWDPAKDMRFGRGGGSLYNPFGFVEQMRIQSSTGNVGIGTMTPGSKLEVDSASVGTASIQGNATATSGSTAGVGGTSNSPNGTGVGGINNAATGGNGGTFLSNATSGNANGVYGQSASTNGNGVNGNAIATSGFANGVVGTTVSPSGSGVVGFNNATSGFAVGTVGQTASPNGTGVNGVNIATSGGNGGNFTSNATSGNANGVYGQSASTNGNGVNGNAIATSGFANGVVGTTVSPNGSGVVGFNNATSGFAVGTVGQTASPNGAGVNGVNIATSGGNGGNFTSNATSGSAAGVRGQCASPVGWGVLGVNNATSGFAVGVYGESGSQAGAGVTGFSATASGGNGVIGITDISGTAVYGINQTCPNNVCTPVAGIAGLFKTGAGGTVLAGIGGTTQVFHVDSSGNGFFAGNLNVTGALSKGSGSFKIDHPLDPANKYLSHSFVESPDMMDVYNGVAKLDPKGEAWVNLPEYFEALNGDFRYQLTAVGAPAPRLYVAKEVSQNRFKIAGGRPGGRVSWQVTGIRHDAYANAHRIPVTEDKPSTEQGRYLHPDAFGQGEGRQIGAGH